MRRPVTMSTDRLRWGTWVTVIRRQGTSISHEDGSTASTLPVERIATPGKGTARVPEVTLRFVGIMAMMPPDPASTAIRRC
jgi:hypothetical protein